MDPKKMNIQSQLISWKDSNWSQPQSGNDKNKTTRQQKPGEGGASGGMGAHDLVNGWQAPA